ncbi:MAG: GDP-mannose 4,6-dehydratase [Defluviitaleaceae bacterium]|nr:GDP-mannose 4,6-dehydratase [Defluviitaleaceae bacterium]MCL2261623.1 GDP-mannose 4,6-dehydratase [Defluviitaleaceae bacterium]
MKIMVTGGAGFIGSHVCEALLKKGHDVCIFDSFNDYYSPEYKRENVQNVEATAIGTGTLVVIEGDIRDADALRQCFSSQKFDAVIHLAAYAGVRPSIENAPLYMDVNINGTVQLLECMKEFGVKNLLFASSSSVYGNNEKVPFCETDNVDFPISPYAATKKAGELICHTYQHLYEMSVACLRFFTVYGPRQRPDLAIYKFTDKLYKNEDIPFYGDGTMGRDYTYVDDTVSGVLGALDYVCAQEKCFEVLNLGESYTVPLSEMLTVLERETGITAKVNKLPVPPGDVNITWANIEKAKRLVGYNPTTHFDDGIKKFIKWFEKERGAK